MNSHKDGYSPGMLYPDIIPIMYGHGDSKAPDWACVAFMEEIVVDYLIGMAEAANQLKKKTKTLNHAMFLDLLTKDTNKFNRAEYLIGMNEKIKEAQKLEIAKTEFKRAKSSKKKKGTGKSPAAKRAKVASSDK